MYDTNSLPDGTDPSSDTENSVDPQNPAEENLQGGDSTPGAAGNVRHRRKHNRQIATLKTITSQKMLKLERISSECDAKRATLDRGYFIVDDKDNEGHTKHVMLKASDKEVLRSEIAVFEYEMFNLKSEISDSNAQIQQLASVKRSSYKDKLAKERQNKAQEQLVTRTVNGIKEKASDGANKEAVSNIQQQIISGNRNEAYKSLLTFLRKELTPVVKKLDKDSDREEKVINKVLDKILSI